MTRNSAPPHSISLRGSATIAVALALSLITGTVPWNAAAQTLPPTDRIAAGTDVVTSAVSLSQHTFPDARADVVVLGRDDDFPDTLAATALAGSFGPILYTTGGADAEIRPETLAEIMRLRSPSSLPCDQTDDVIIVGGPNAVSDAAAQQIRDAGLCVRRIEGPTRFETARSIASEVRERTDAPSAAIVVRADDWADAATAGAFAAFSGTPVIVTETGSLHPEARAFLAAPMTTEAVIIGGTAAISEQTETEIAGLVDTRRVAGAARDLTALAIATELWDRPGLPGNRVQLLNGYTEFGWAYAFAAAPLSARDATPPALHPARCPAVFDLRVSGRRRGPDGGAGRLGRRHHRGGSGAGRRRHPDRDLRVDVTPV